MSKNPKLKKLLARKKFDTAKERIKKSGSVGGDRFSKFDLGKVDNIDDKFDAGIYNSSATFEPNFGP